ncbi:hypothetical protein C5167_023896 [Papaver somniferum]|uniref:Uncharacterized protein n=1 Tax=Papaver somniferum TaxID=3469 RepID=A0A4Y7JQS6_PAPSO|nr:transcription factor MafB-like [Papaver somniferum]RZC62158.1 hypothetical protein C5167_023896 [Papaver somniferum]
MENETRQLRIPGGIVHHYPHWYQCPPHHHHQPQHLHHHHHSHHLHHHHHHLHPHHLHHQHHLGGHNLNPCIHHNLTSHPNLNHFHSCPNFPPPPATIPCRLQSGTSVTIPGTLNVETSSGSKEQQGSDYQFVHEEYHLEEEQEEEEEAMYVMTDEWLEFFAKSEAKRKLEKQQAKLKKKQQQTKLEKKKRAS